MVSETLSTIRDPRSFLCTIAKRVMVDLFRRNALEKRIWRCWRYAGGGAPPEERESQLEDPTTPRQHAGRLNGKTREAFLLQLDGLTYSEIAHKLVFHHQPRKIRGESRRALPAVPSEYGL